MIDRILDLFRGNDPLRETRRLLEEQRIADAFHQLNDLKATHTQLTGVDYLRARCFLAMNQPHAAIEAVKEELRYHPQDKAAQNLFRELTAKHPPTLTTETGELGEILNAIQAYTMVGPKRLQSLYARAREVCEHRIPGNFVECGVAAGGSSALLAKVIQKHSAEPRRMFSFDSFEGMPAPTDHDKHQGHSAQATGWGAGTCAAPEASLMEVCAKLGVTDQVTPVKGLFEHTLPIKRGELGTIAFLHVDGDWYSSTRAILDNLFDQLAPGARVQIDDYGYWEGCERAVTEFMQERKLKLDLQQIDETGVWFIR